MRKYYSILLALLLGGLVAQAQITTFPVVLDFENEFGEWTTVSYNGESADNWSVYNTSSYSHSGTKVGRILGYSYSGGYIEYTPDEMLISPQMTINDDNMVLEFWTNGTLNLSIYVSTTIPDTNSAIDTTIYIYGWNSPHTMISLSDYYNQNVYIGIRYHGLTGYTGYIDDITIRSANMPIVKLPEITMLKTEDPNIIGAELVEGNLSGLTYSWTSSMAAAGLAIMTNDDSDTLTIVYSTQGFDTITVTASNSFGSNADTIVVRVIDLNPVTELPYSTGFEEDDDVAWNIINDTINGWHIDTAAHFTGNYGLYVSNDSGAHNTYATSYYDYNYGTVNTAVGYAIRAIEFTDTGNYSYSYDWRCKGEYYYSSYSGSYSFYDYMNVWLADSYEVTPGVRLGSYSTPVPSGWIPLTPSGKGLGAQSTWQNQSGLFHIDSACTKYVVIMWCNNRTYCDNGGTFAAAVDNFSIAQLNCDGITDLTVTDLTATTATITWTGHDETQWAVSINGSADSIVTSNTFIINGLTPATDYSIRVRAICGPLNESLSSQISFRTECEPLGNFPIINDFEDITSAGSYEFTPCWERGSNNSYGDYPYVNTENGNKYLYFYGYSSFGNQIYSYLLLPVTTVSVDSLEVSFDLAHDNIVIGVINTDTYIPDSTIIDTVGVFSNSSSIWKNFAVDFDGHPGQRIIMITDANINYTTPYIDNISIYPIPSCKSPNNIKMTGANSNWISLAWNSNGTGAINYDVAYRPTDDTEPEWQHLAATDSSITVASLSPATQYTFMIRAICAPGDTSYAKTAKFTTRCTPINAYPYFEGFESGFGCWAQKSNSVYSSDDWKVNNYTRHSGSKSLASGYNNSSITDATLISPTFTIPEENADYISLIFWAYHNAYDESYATTPILVMVNTTDNPFDLNAYTDTILMVPNTVNLTSDNWRKYCVNLSQYAGQTISLAFKHYGNTQISCYLDDIEVRESKTPDISINGSAVADINYPETFSAKLNEGSLEGITYNWTSTMQAAGTATLGSTSSAGINVTYSAIGTDTLRLIVTNTFGADTAFKVVTVRNTNPVNIPYRTGFEDATDNDKWQLLNTADNNKWYFGNAVSYTGDKALYLSDDGGLTNHYNRPNNSLYLYALRGINFADTGTYYITYDWRGNGGSYGQYLYTYLMAPNQIVAGGTYISGSYKSLTDDGLRGSTDWSHASHIINITKPGIYQICFHAYASNYYNAANPPTAIDNFEIGFYTCHEPSLVGANNITDSSAKISWLPGGQEELWEVTVGNNAPVVVSTNSYTVTGLDDFTVYDIKVRGICGTGDTSFGAYGRFRTLCTPIVGLPWVEDFESYEESQRSSNSSNPVYLEQEIDCWSHMGGDIINIFKNDRDSSRGKLMTFNPLSYYSSYGNTPEYFLGSSIMMLPDFYPTISALEMDVYIAPSDPESDKLQIGYLTNPENTASFVSLAEYDANDSTFFDTISGNAVFQQKHVNFSTAPEGARIAFRRIISSAEVSSVKHYYWYVDSVVVNIIDGVNPYFCADPDSIWQANATQNLVVVDWTPSSDNQPTETKWEIMINTENAPRIVTSHPYVFNGLEPGHEYTVKIRALCNRHAESEWHEEITVRTLTADSNGIYSSSAVTFGLYPNPASSTVTLDMSNISNATVAIIDMNGRKADEWKVSNDKVTVDVSKYARGAYFVRMTSAEGTAVRKLIIQ